MRKINRYITLQICLYLLFLNVVWAQPLDSKNQKLCVMVILDRVDIKDLTDCPNIRDLIDTGALALMNTNTAGRYDPESAYLTIGAGTRASAVGSGREVLSFDEEYDGYDAGDVFEIFTGITPDKSNLLVMDITSIIADNNKQDHDIVPGLLGDELKRHQIPVTCLGNADGIARKNRLSGLIGMDSRGVVNQGVVNSSINMYDPGRPFFVKTDYDKLYQEFYNYKDQGGLLILHLGDLVRAYDIADRVTDSKYVEYRSLALRDADQFIGKVIHDLDLQRDLLLLVTPFPSLEGYRERSYLTPFVISGPGISQGLALSGTTRRPGLVTNLDIAPTILSHFGISTPYPMLGNIIESRFAKDSLKTLIEANHRITSTYNQRANIIRTYVAMLTITSLSFIISVFVRPQWLSYLRPVIIGNLAVPFALLILPMVASTQLTSKYLWLILITSAVVVASRCFKTIVGSVSFVCLLVALGVLIDLAFGAQLMKQSILGYDPIGGARYYGIGNEYMGVVIGALTVGVMGLLDALSIKYRYKILGVGLVFSIGFYMISSPNYGTNFGGALSSYIAFFTTLALMAGVKIDRKMALPGFIAITAAMAAVYLFLSIKGPPSHISQVFASIKSQGINPLVSVIERKLKMNLKLFRYTPWTRALLTTIGVTVTLFFYPFNLLRRIFNKHAHLHHGFLGASLGSLVALICNDSGIVAAATMMIYIALPLFLLVIEEINISKQNLGRPEDLERN